MALSNDQKTALNFKNFFDYIKAYFNQAYGNVEVPENVSDLNNDTGFITNTVNNLLNYYLKTETYTKTEINTLINNAASGGFIKVNELPFSDINTKAIYLVPYTGSKAKNLYEEYIYIDNDWEMIGTTKLDLSNYVTTTALNTALADYVTSTDINTLLADYVTASSLNTTLSGYPTTGTMNTALNGKQDKIQYSPMPTAGADYVGQILQYMGVTNANYIHGYFYECTTDGTTYEWTQANTQPGGGGHAIKDEDTALTQRDTLDFTDFDITDDSTDEETDIAPHRLTAEEMAEIVSPLPTVPVKGINYSTEEQIIGKWIDGKTLYQKTFVMDTLTKLTGLSNIDNVFLAKVQIINNNGYIYDSFNYSDTTFAYACVKTDGTEIVIVKGSSVVITECYITLQYTKTTDVVS